MLCCNLLALSFATLVVVAGFPSLHIAALVVAAGFPLFLHCWYQLLPVASVFGLCSFQLLPIQVEVGGGCMLASSGAPGCWFCLLLKLACCFWTFPVSGCCFLQCLALCCLCCFCRCLACCFLIADSPFVAVWLV